MRFLFCNYVIICNVNCIYCGSQQQFKMDFIKSQLLQSIPGQFYHSLGYKRVHVDNQLFKIVYFLDCIWEPDSISTSTAKSLTETKKAIILYQEKLLTFVYLFNFSFPFLLFPPPLAFPSLSSFVIMELNFSLGE